MIQFLSDNIWTTLKNLSKKSKQTRVAVAYFGTGGAEQLTFREGDTLIVAMDLNNVKAGQVNPFEIQKLYDKGVLIYNLRNLHSKIYIFNKKVIVGSANVSSNSTTLIESGILTDDKASVLRANNFIKENSVEKVEQDYLELCKKNYNPPKFFGKRIKTSKNETFKGKLSSLWIINTRLIDNSDEDLVTIEKDKKVFERKISNKRTFQLKEIKYPNTGRFIKNVQEGDMLIELLNHNTQTLVFHPKRALGVTLNKNKKNAFLRVEERKKPITKRWAALESILRKNGIKTFSKHSTREIKNEDTKKVLLSLFN